MKLSLRALPTLALAAALAAPVSAANVATKADASTTTATICVVHGIPGQDLGLAPTLPVDVEVNGAVVLAGFESRDIAGPLSLAEDTYLIEVSLANELNPGSNPAVISANVPLFAGEDATIVAHLDVNGAPTASKFVNDLSPAGVLRARVGLHHTAAAPAVDLDLDRVFPRVGASINLAGVTNGQAAIIDLLFGIFTFQGTVSGTTTMAFGPSPGFLLPGLDYRVYVVGSASTGSLTLIVQVLPILS